MVNRKAKFNYDILDEYSAGIMLIGCEVKSIRIGDASINESYCYFQNDDLYIKNMHIKPYGNSYEDVDPVRDRKLLLKDRELKKIKRLLNEKGLTIIPLSVNVNNRVKLLIGVGRGKKLHDKKQTIKLKDLDRDLKQSLK